MDLDRRAIEIRPRTPWEACDLGVQMGRHWWWPMVRLWLAITAPWLVLCWLVPAQYATVPVLLYWLGKPLWERVLLQFLSQAIFNAQPSTLQVVQSSARLLRKDWLASILWRRFSPWRAYNSALTVLEEQTGRGRRQRLEHLNGDNAATAAKVATLLMHLEGFLLLSGWVIAYNLTPDDFNWDITHISELMTHGVLAAAYNTLYIIVSAAVAPFFVATGFALYLNRRIWLEAWDIDISFKALAKRLGATVFLLALCTGLWVAPMDAMAINERAAPAPALPQTTDPSLPATGPSLPATNPSNPTSSANRPPDTIGKALTALGDPAALLAGAPMPAAIKANYPAEQAALQKILAGEDFHHKEPQLTHRWRWEMNKPGKKTSADTAFWRDVIGVTAKVLEVVLWCLVIALIFWLVLNYRKLLARFSQTPPRSKVSPSPMVAFGLDLRPSSLPEDVAAAALTYCQNGEFRLGLSLLYRATLVALVQQGLAIKPSFTEEDCLAQARQSHLQIPPACIDYLTQLTGHWQTLAYGHQNPPPPLAEDLCQRWSALWQPLGADHA